MGSKIHFLGQRSSRQVGKKLPTLDSTRRLQTSFFFLLDCTKTIPLEVLALGNVQLSGKKKKYITNTAFVLNATEPALFKNLNRQQCVKIVRLISGYTADPSFLFLIGRAPSAECVCGHNNNNIEHALWHCQQHIVRRYRLTDSLVSLGHVTFPLNLQHIIVNRDIAALKIILEFLSDIEFPI